MKTFCNLKMFTTYYNKMYSTQKIKWDIMAGICLQRKPVITKSLTNFEVNYQNMLQEIEFENSLKSDHELKHDKDVHKMKQLKDGIIHFDDLDPASNQSAQDYSDKNKEELSKFKFSGRITEADKKNDNKSLNRKLEENLVFVIKQKLGHEDFWILPQGLWINGETLKETAERILKESCGNRIKVRFYGNAPCGFYKYKYPKQNRDQTNIEGAKIFFFKAILLDGNIEEKSTWIDYEWATIQELNNRFVHPYMKSVKLFLSNYNLQHK